MKTLLQILIASVIVAVSILLLAKFLIPKANAEILIPSTISVEQNGKNVVFNYLTYRAYIINKQNIGKLPAGINDESKMYMRIINFENKLKRLKGRTIKEINNEILTR